MDKPEKGTVFKELQSIWLYGIPLGQILLGLSRMSNDAQTQETLREIPEKIEEQGVLVFDAHQKIFDIMTVAMQLGKELPINHMSGFIAAKWFDKSKIGSTFVKTVNSKDHLTLIPVIRKEDNKHVSKDKFSNRYVTNDEHLDTIRKQLDSSHSIAVMAPYGSRSKFLQPEYLRRGTLQLAREFPTICSLAVFNPKLLKYVVRLSEVLSFSNSDDQEIKNGLQKQFTSLAKNIL